MFPLILFFGLCGSVRPSQAQDIWSGATSTNWFDGGNWSFESPPTSAEAAFVNGPVPATIAGPGAVANQLFIGVTPPPPPDEDAALDLVSDPTGSVIVNGANATLTLSGSEPLYLADFPAYSLDISNGSLLVENGGTVTATSVNIDPTGQLLIGSGGLAGTFNAATIVDNGLIQADFTDTTTLAASISGSGQLVKLGSGTLILTGTNTYSGLTTISGGTLQIGNGGTSGSITSNVLDNGILVFDRSDSFTFAGAISGTGNLIKQGAGTLTLSGTNSYTGTTTVSAGTLQAGSTGAFSSGSAFSVNTGATLDLNGFNNTIGSLSGSGTVLNNGSAPATLTAGGNNTSTLFSGVIEDGSTLQLIKSGTGTLTLTGTNTYTGGTTINGGTLQLGNGGTTGSITGNVIDNGTLAFDRSDVYTFSGVISGTGAVEQIGTGTTVLTGTNTYTGMTTVDSGTLIVNGSIASTETLVGPAGVLGGTGVIGGNLVNNGIVSPGAPVGTLTVSGNYTQNPSGTLRIQIAGLAPGQFGLLAVGGHASLAGTLQLNALNGFKLQVGNTLTFLTAGGGVSGSFSTVQNPFISDTIVKAQVIELADAVEILAVQGNFVDAACNPNSAAVAQALNNAVGDPRASALIAFLDSQPIQDLCADFQLISPEQMTSTAADWRDRP